MRRACTILAIAVALAGVSPPAMADACMHDHSLWTPLAVVDGRPLVDASVAGVPMRVMLDTGAEAGVVPPDVVAASRLEATASTVEIHAHGLQGDGGTLFTAPVSVAGADLGAFPFVVAPSEIGGESTVVMPGALGGGSALYLDFADGWMAVMDVASCPGYQPFAGRHVVLPLVEGHRLPHVMVSVAGHPFPALVDTGASMSLMGPAAVAALGISGSFVRSGLPVTARVFGGAVTSGRVVGAPLGLGGLSLPETSFAIMPQEDDAVVLGMNVLRRFDVFLDPAAAVLRLRSRP